MLTWGLGGITQVKIIIFNVTKRSWDQNQVSIVLHNNIFGHGERPWKWVLQHF